MRMAIDHAWKRPALAFYSAADASKVEPIAPLDKLARLLRINRNIGHQRASNRALGVAKDLAANFAARAIGADNDLAVKIAPASRNEDTVRPVGDPHNRCILDNLQSSIYRRAGELRIESVAPDDGAQNVPMA